MRDDKRQIKVLFSKSIEIGDSNLAEVRAIREAFLILSASKWAISHSLVIESDSQNAVKWINAPGEAPWRFRKWMLHIEKLKKGIRKWEVNHIFRENNQLPDRLAKEGVMHHSDVLKSMRTRCVGSASWGIEVLGVLRRLRSCQMREAMYLGELRIMIPCLNEDLIMC
ncbi:Uncharacterized protein TCM_001756 [Theobroma cacao]|uniref:RNase H type-1 domain-containing protein n=1 Tax=Theobroma cacao TaxID=3641 RepID=A0A061DJM6_THECC|nr:Uncharacterized protein TCM_001756 [Theobroma cacao]